MGIFLIFSIFVFLSYVDAMKNITPDNPQIIDKTGLEFQNKMICRNNINLKPYIIKFKPTTSYL